MRLLENNVNADVDVDSHERKIGSYVNPATIRKG